MVSPIDAVTKFFDPYSRVARLYPSLIALAPVLWSALALFPSFIDSWSHSVAFAIGATCFFYFLSSISRSLGKRAEPHLLELWGGWPTTALLRHRDRTLDALTKARYHRALEAMTNLTLPTVAEEQCDPDAADAYYRSATKKLIEQRRGAEYTLLHNENASYGFRRNLYGLKSLSLIETVLLITLTVFGWWTLTPQPYNRHIVAQSVIVYPHFPILLAADLFYAIIWVFSVTRNFVYQSSKEYAEALFRTLDS